MYEHMAKFACHNLPPTHDWRIFVRMYIIPLIKKPFTFVKGPKLSLFGTYPQIYVVDNYLA